MSSGVLLTIQVTDLERSAAFYERLAPLLGYVGNEHYLYEKRRGQFRFQLLELEDEDTRTSSQKRTGRAGVGLFGLTFEISTSEDFESIAQSLTKLGIKYERSVESPSGSARLVIFDPDRIKILVRSGYYLSY